MSRVAIIGAGYWGKNLVRNFHEMGVLGAVCDTSPENLNLIKKKYPDVKTFDQIEEVIDNPVYPAVVIATPAETHAKFVEQSLLAGKDVFVEKPLSLDVKSGRHLVTLAKQQNRILMVGHLLWYHPAILKLQNLIKDGDLGRIRYIYSNRLNLGKIRQEENILWSFAPHDISIILGLLDEMPSHVTAQGGNYLHPNIADVTVSCFDFPSGKKAHIFVSWLHPFKEQKLIVVGEKKMAVFNDLERDKKLQLYPHTIEWKGNLPIPSKADAEVIPLDIYEPLRAECEHFMDCIKTRKTPRTDGEEGIRVLSVLQSCQDALEGSGKKAVPFANAQPTSYFAHESAFIDKDVVIGKGTNIWHVSHVLKGSKIGENCKIGQNVVIGPNVNVGNSVKIQNNVGVFEGVTIEDDVFCGPSMVFTNVINPRSAIPRMQEIKKTLIKKGATLGANCTILCGHTIGKHSFIAAGAVVTKDVPDYALVVGNPARITGWMCECGVKLKQSANKIKCPKCNKRFEKNQHVIAPVTPPKKKVGK